MPSDISAMLWGSRTDNLRHYCFRGLGLPYPKGGHDLNLYLRPSCASRDDSAKAFFLAGGGGGWWDGCRASAFQQSVGVHYIVPLPLTYKKDAGDTIATVYGLGF